MLKEKGLLYKPELRRFLWSEVRVWSSGGSFYIGSQKEVKFVVSATYTTMPNTHVLERLVRMAFERGGAPLSAILV
jgi:hypothetical protein